MFKAEAQKELVKLVGYKHRVHLQNPDKVIIVEVFPKACGVSIVEGSDFERFKQLNLRSISDGLALDDAVDPTDDKPKKGKKASEKQEKDAQPQMNVDSNSATTNNSHNNNKKNKQTKPKPVHQNKGRKEDWQEEEQDDDDDPEGDQLWASLSEREVADKTRQAMGLALGLEFDEKPIKDKHKHKHKAKPNHTDQEEEEEDIAQAGGVAIFKQSR